MDSHVQISLCLQKVEADPLADWYRIRRMTFWLLSRGVAKKLGCSKDQFKSRSRMEGNKAELWLVKSWVSWHPPMPLPQQTATFTVRWKESTRGTMLSCVKWTCDGGVGSACCVIQSKKRTALPFQCYVPRLAFRSSNLPRPLIRSRGHANKTSWPEVLRSLLLYQSLFPAGSCSSLGSSCCTSLSVFLQTFHISPRLFISLPQS